MERKLRISNCNHYDERVRITYHTLCDLSLIPRDTEARVQLVRQLGAEMEQTRMGSSLVIKASNGGIEVQGIYPPPFPDPGIPRCEGRPPYHMPLIYGFQT